MNVNQIPNIEHCNQKKVFVGGKLVGYTITAHDGYLIHLNNEAEDTQDVWVKTITISVYCDFSQVEIREDKDIPIQTEID